MLETTGAFQLYTIPLGWHMSAIIYELLSSTGLWLLPILGFVLDHLISERSRASAMNNKGDSTLSALEIKIFITILVMLLAVRPSAATGLSGNTMSYTPPGSIYTTGAPAAQTLGNTGSPIDDIFADTSGYDPANGSIPVPPLWFLVMQLSHGMSYAMVDNLNDRGDLYRSLRRISESATITDPENRAMYANFLSQCYNPARAAYLRDNGSNSADDGEINWVGGDDLVDDYYPGIRVIDPVAGFPFVAAHNTDIVVASGDPTPDVGRPMCNDYYDELIVQVLSEISDDRTEGFIQNGVGFAELIGVVGITTDERREQLVEWYLRGSTVAVNRTADAAMAIGEADDKAYTNIAQVFSDVLQGYDGSKMAIVAELFKDSALTFVNYMQGFALMILYMAIPIIMLIGGYSLSTIVSISLAIFTLNFLPVLWALVSWVDNSVGMALFADRNTLTTAFMDMSIDAVKSQAILSIVVGALYLAVAPMFIGFLSLGNRTIMGLNGAVSALGLAPDVGKGQLSVDNAITRGRRAATAVASPAAQAVGSSAAGRAVSGATSGAVAAAQAHPYGRAAVGAARIVGAATSAAAKNPYK